MYDFIEDLICVPESGDATVTVAACVLALITFAFLSKLCYKIFY